VSLHDTTAIAFSEADVHQYCAGGVDWDATGYQIFQRMISLGLQPRHTVLDVGCGGLRVGRYLIEYLSRSSYFGVEPRRELVDLGSRSLPPGLIKEKDPQYCLNDSFYIAGVFPCSFDFILMSSIWTHASHRQIKTMLESASAAGTRHVIILADYRDCGCDYVLVGTSIS
jgi:SAM-dependent methyltransferase